MTTERNPTLPTGWTFTDADRRLAETLGARLPAHLFDAHLHVYRTEYLRPVSTFIGWGPEKVGVDVWRECVGGMFGPDRLQGGLVLPMPSRDGDPNLANTFAREEVKSHEMCVGAMVIRPGDRPEELWPRFEDGSIKCLKPYHFFSSRQPGTFDSSIEEFLPAWAWRLADELGLVIVLHMVRDRALNDESNLADIHRLCEAHPNAKLVLAHAGRGFHAPNTVQGIEKLGGVENVWFDSSAVCEAEGLAAILQTFGPRRLMWGSDFPVSQQRGRCVTLGNGFAWVVTDGISWPRDFFYGDPCMVGLESCRALLEATDRLGLDADDLRDVFCDNAMRLFGLTVVEPDRTQALYRRARSIIPGGTQLVSKRPEMFAPEQWPAYYREARGCEIWDLDDRHYYDVSTHGIGAVILGYRDPDVTRAVRRRLELGSYSTLNPPEELRLAELLLDLHPWATRARFGRCGGETMAVAVRIARATTDRSVVAICGYHGWHDWYLAANLGEDDTLRGHLLPGLQPLGVPRELRETTQAFTYNNRDELQHIVDEFGDRLAAVVMEPCRHAYPDPGFLEFVRDTAHCAGALLIFDEITIGWRLACGGAHLRLDVAPDMAVFAKSLGNGHPMAAVIGTSEAMEGAHGSFISSTYWTEGIGPAAAIAAIEKMKRIDVPAHCEQMGLLVQQAWRDAAARHGLPVEVPECFPALAHFTFTGDHAQELKTLYVQLMLERGFLAATSIYVCLAHTEEIVSRYAEAIDEVFGELVSISEAGKVNESLKGPVAHTGFRRLL